MRLRTAAAAVTLGAALVLSACSDPAGTGAGSAPSPGETSGAASPAPEQSSPGVPAPSATPSPVATLAPATCLTGRYALVRFVAVGSSTYGTGQGGDVTVSFADGRYTLRGAGRKPMVVTVGGQSGNLTVDGESKAAYRLAGDTATFAEPTVTGGGTLASSAGGPGQKLTMKQVNSVIGLSGEGKVACTAQAMTITLNAIRLELGRV